jgi:hypothetical protein
LREIALERQSRWAASDGQLVQAHVAEFRLPQAEVAASKGETFVIWSKLRESLDGVAVGVESLHYAQRFAGKAARHSN